MKSLGIIVMITITSMVIGSSCSDSFWNCVDGNGRSASVRRVVGDFTNVTSYGDFIVDVKSGSQTSVVVEADDNLLSYIETYIQGNSLVIQTSNDRCLKSSDRVYIHVITPAVYELKLSGSGVIYCDSVSSDELKYVLAGSGSIQSKGLNAGFIDADISGSGEIILSGIAQQSDFIVSGSGNIKSIGLEQDKCISTISGSGNIYAFVNSQLDVLISGSGNVIYKGSPAIVQNITGSGRVIKY